MYNYELLMKRFSQVCGFHILSTQKNTQKIIFALNNQLCVNAFLQIQVGHTGVVKDK